MAGTEREKKAIRSGEEVADLKQKIAFLARVFSGVYGIRLIPGQGWACSLGREAQEAFAEYIAGEGKRLEEMDPELFAPTHILYQEESLYEWPLPAILGVARHEVGHVRHTDFRVPFMGQRQAVVEGRLPTSWMELFNSVEDPWVNNLEIAGSEAVRHNMKALYGQSRPEVEKKINSQPLVRQLGLNINQWWFTGEEIPTIKNRKVREVFAEIKEDVETYFTGESAQANYRLLQEKIWPKIKELEEAGVKQEMMKRLMEGLAGRKFGGGGGGGLMGRIKEWMDKGEEIDENLRRQVGGGTAKGVVREFERQEKKQSEKKQSEGKEEKGEQPGSPFEKKMIDDLDLEEVEQGLRQALEREIAGLPVELKRKLEKEARKRMDGKQAEALEGELPAVIEVKKGRDGRHRMVMKVAGDRQVDEGEKKAEQAVAETEAEGRENLSTDGAPGNKESEEEAARRGLEQRMREAGFKPEERETYLKYMEIEAAVRGQVENFVMALERYLPKRERYDYRGDFFTGPKIDWGKVAQRVPVGKYDIFERRHAVEAREAKLFAWLLIDRSGSMAGAKMKESLKTAVFEALALKHFDVPLSISFFGDHLDKVMEFGQDYDDPRLRIKPRLAAMADASGGATDLGAGLTKVGEETLSARRKYMDCQGVVFVISDGEANRGIVGAELKGLIGTLRENLLVYGFDLSGRGEVVKYFGGEYGVAVSDFSQLPGEAFRILRATLTRVLAQRRAGRG